MPEDTMNHEQEKTTNQKEPGEHEEQKSVSTELPIIEITDPSRNAVRLTDRLRILNIQNVREGEAEEKFLSDVNFSERLRAISEAFPQTALSSSDPGQYYNAEQLRDAYTKSSGEKKKVIRSGLRSQIDGRKKRVFSILSNDLHLLYKDQGLSWEEIDHEMESLTTGKVGNKRREIRQLSSGSQIGLLGNMAEVRMNLLVGNFDYYMYLLSFSDPIPMSKSEEDSQARRRQRFIDANTIAEKARISVETRKLADKRMEEVIDTQVGLDSADKRMEEVIDILTGLDTKINGRLGPLLLLSGAKMPLIRRELALLRDRFHIATLPERANLLSEIQERKLILALPYLGEITKLRRTIEKDLEFEKNITGEITPEQRLQEEVERILHLLVAQNSFHRTISEVEIEELRDDIKSLSRTFEDPNLINTFEVVLLLRNSSEEYFRL